MLSPLWVKQQEKPKNGWPLPVGKGFTNITNWVIPVKTDAWRFCKWFVPVQLPTNINMTQHGYVHSKFESTNVHGCASKLMIQPPFFMLKKPRFWWCFGAFSASYGPHFWGSHQIMVLASTAAHNCSSERIASRHILCTTRSRCDAGFREEPFGFRGATENLRSCF